MEGISILIRKGLPEIKDKPMTVLIIIIIFAIIPILLHSQEQLKYALFRPDPYKSHEFSNQEGTGVTS